MKGTSHAGVAVVLLGLVACATGPTLQESRAKVPTVPADQGRIYFYRTGSPFGSAIQPSVRLDGAVVGESIPNAVFFCDVTPGRHKVSVETEVEKSAEVEVKAGQSSYVRMDQGMGWLYARVHIEVVPAETGASEAATSSLVASSCPTPAT